MLRGQIFFEELQAGDGIEGILAVLDNNMLIRSGIHLASRNMHTAHFGSDTISSLGPKL